MGEKERKARKQAHPEPEKILGREKTLDPFSQAIREKKESLYDRVKLSVRQMDVIIWIVSGLLFAVIVLIALEAAGIFRLSSLFPN